jgi:carbon storage regulator
MLVLTRKPGERVLAPDCELTITVLAIERNRVRLGISGPDGVAVYREEVWQRERLRSAAPRTRTLDVDGGARSR